jgi:hypothetical protein
MEFMGSFLALYLILFQGWGYTLTKGALEPGQCIFLPVVSALMGVGGKDNY